jgi:hypothetical protein
MENIYSIWKTGYSVNTALSVELVGETERAYKFKVLNSDRDYTFFLPKAAVSFDKKIQGVINLKRWFTVEGFLSYIFDNFASHYRR